MLIKAEDGRVFSVREWRDDRGRRSCTQFVEDFLTEYPGASSWVLGSPWLEADYKHFGKCLEEFHRWLSKTGVKYLSVIEIGLKGKRLHVHMLTDGYLPRDEVLGMWRRVTHLAEPHVYVRPAVDVVYEHNKRNGEALSAAEYFGKGFGYYVTKGDVKFRRLRSSKGLRGEVGRVRLRSIEVSTGAKWYCREIDLEKVLERMAEGV